MCCFSGKVSSVSRTNIFARLAGSRQYLVYEMMLSADEEVAMILPLPVARGSAEDAVEFISFADYPDFFKDMASGFPAGDVDKVLNRARLMPRSAPLKVHQVGAFEASFVPSPKDFSRLDPRFRLPENVWSKLPEYKDFGFAVFKLRPGREQQVHPMAFFFPTRHPERLFFPTIHIHDGEYHSLEEFDHALYCQVANPGRHLRGEWNASTGPTKQFLQVGRTAELVEGEMPCYRRRLKGKRDNQDTYVEL